LAVVVLFLVVQIGRVYFYHPFFVKRTAILENVLDQMDEQGITKAMLPFYKAPMKKIMFIGATGNESLLLSKLRDPDRASTFVYILADTIDPRDMIPDTGIFLNNEWEKTPLSTFNPKYFDLDPSRTYDAFYPDYSK
jgi:hypothetical protein